MEIKLFDRVFICENRLEAVDQAFEQIHQLLMTSNQRVSCLEVDETAVYTDFERYIANNLAEINTIIVRVKTLKELLDEAIVSIQDYAARAIPEIDKLVDQFFREVNQETWNTFSNLLEGLQFIMDTLEVLSSQQALCKSFERFILLKQEMARKICSLQAALESQDRVRLSDVLLYEIIPSLQALIGKSNESAFSK